MSDGHWYFGKTAEMEAIWDTFTLSACYNGEMPWLAKAPIVDKEVFHTFENWLSYLFENNIIEEIEQPDDKAWKIYSSNDPEDYAWFEVHMTEDSESPSGVAWYFEGHAKDEYGAWQTYDGGMFWGYPSADALKDECDEAVLPERYDGEVIEMPYEVFDQEIWG